MTPLREIDMQPVAVRDRSGVALPMVLGAMVLIGVLIAGVMFASLQEFRIGGNTTHQARAATAAEFGLNRVMAEWKPTNNMTAVTGDTLKWLYTLSSGGTATVTATRMPGPFYWVVSEGQAGPKRADLSARRQYGSMFRLDQPDIGFLGALTARGGVTVGGSAYVSGTDMTASGWKGCPATANVAGVALPDTAGAKTPGCSVSKTCVSGTPAFLQTVAAKDTSVYFNYGNTNYTTLAATASKIIAPNTTITSMTPSVVGGVCNTALLTNWGDANRNTPAGKCESYFPVIHALGNIHITGGVGQGILLVDGDLQMSGSAWFVGVVIVRGTLRTSGSGAGVFGVVMAANVSLDETTTIIGNSYIQYSSCAVANVLAASAMVVPVKERAWIEVF
jgi:hypothetical protein